MEKETPLPPPPQHSKSTLTLEIPSIKNLRKRGDFREFPRVCREFLSSGNTEELRSQVLREIWSFSWFTVKRENLIIYHYSNVLLIFFIVMDWNEVWKINNTLL